MVNVPNNPLPDYAHRYSKKNENNQSLPVAKPPSELVVEGFNERKPSTHEVPLTKIVKKPSSTTTTKIQPLTRRIRDAITNSIYSISNQTRKIRPNTTGSVPTITNRRAVIQPNSLVRKFLTNPTSQNIRTFLDKICPNTGQCISFGVETDKIRRYFNNFDFALSITNERQLIGSRSSNGFIIEIPFVKDDYKLYSILKSAKKANADNLYYEAFVGIFINKKNDIYPCFLETYGSYYWPESQETNYTNLLEGNTRVDLRLMKHNPLTYDFFLHLFSFKTPIFIFFWNKYKDCFLYYIEWIQKTKC